MEVSQKLLDEFKTLMKKRGREYKSDDEASKQSKRLVKFFEILIKVDQRNKQKK